MESLGRCECNAKEGMVVLCEEKPRGSGLDGRHLLLDDLQVCVQATRTVPQTRCVTAKSQVRAYSGPGGCIGRFSSILSHLWPSRHNLLEPSTFPYTQTFVMSYEGGITEMSRDTMMSPHSEPLNST
jgi:hypothetical protein